MKRFSDFLKEHLGSLHAKPYDLAQWARNLEEPIHEQYIYRLCRGEEHPTDRTLKRLASIPALKISYTKLKAWQLLDEFGPDGAAEIIDTLKVLHEEACRIHS